jgi:hypothetical protein
MSRDLDINLKHHHTATHYNVCSESGTIMLSTNQSVCLATSQVRLANDVLQSIKLPTSTRHPSLILRMTRGGRAIIASNGTILINRLKPPKLPYIQMRHL